MRGRRCAREATRADLRRRDEGEGDADFDARLPHKGEVAAAQGRRRQAALAHENVRYAGPHKGSSIRMGKTGVRMTC